MITVSSIFNTFGFISNNANKVKWVSYSYMISQTDQEMHSHNLWIEFNTVEWTNSKKLYRISVKFNEVGL